MKQSETDLLYTALYIAATELISDEVGDISPQNAILEITAKVRDLIDNAYDSDENTVKVANIIVPSALNDSKPTPTKEGDK